MALDERKDGDAVVERDGMQFFIDGESVPHLRGATLDFTDGLTGSGFRVVNPNASRTCGCGSSFETTQSALKLGILAHWTDGLWRFPYDPYDEPYARPRRRINYFAWTVAILLLTGFALAAWLGSFYIFDQPERPDSYRILQRLHKIEPPKRFELTAAPGGRISKPAELYERYVGMGAAELARSEC